MTPPGLSQSALEIIKGSLRLVNAIEAGEEPDAAQSQDGLSALNQMLDSWQIDRLAVFTVDSLDFPLVGGQQTYTMGAGGNFNTPRPARIDYVSAILDPLGSDPIELEMQYTNREDDWQGIMLKAVSSTYPFGCYDDGGMPFRRLRMWPIPQDSAQGIRIYAWQPLTQFDNLVTKKQFPPGYAEAIRYNLAPRLADEYEGAVLGPNTQAMASQSLNRLRTSNLEVGSLTCDDVVSTLTTDGSTGLTSTIPPNY